MLTGPIYIYFLPIAGEGLQDNIYAVSVKDARYHVSVIDLEINFWLLKPIVTAVMTSEISLCVQEFKVVISKNEVCRVL